jgi:hypothetical protein
MYIGSLQKLSGLAGLAMLFVSGLLSPVNAAQSLDTIQLDNGLLLRDWIDLPAVQSVQSPLETGERAVTYIKRYGAYRELLDIVWKATRSKPFEEGTITAENAAQRLEELDKARTKLGEWPQLVISHARAASLLGKSDAALADLKSWLKVVPVDDRRRKTIVALVIESEKDDAVVTRYFTVDAALAGLALYFNDTTETFVSFDKATNILVTKAKDNKEITRQYDLCAMGRPPKLEVTVQWNDGVPSGIPRLSFPACGGTNVTVGLHRQKAPVKAEALFRSDSKLASNRTIPISGCGFDFSSPRRVLEQTKIGDALTVTQPSLDSTRAAFLKDDIPHVARFQQALDALMAAQCKNNGGS